MSDAQYGPEITAGREMPSWLRETDRPVMYQNHYREWFEDHGSAPLICNWSWCNIPAIRLLAEHPYYLATEKGFTYWPGGESAPGDWDGGPVLLRNGLDKGFGGDWRHGARVPPSTEIIGYRRKIDPTIAELKLPNPVSEWSLARVRELSGASAIEYAFARYIQAHEQPPVDPDVLAVREILAAYCEKWGGAEEGDRIRSGLNNDGPGFQAALAAYCATLPK